MTNTLSRLACVMLSILLFAGLTPQAQAATRQDQVDRILTEYGGTQVGESTISWNDGQVVLQLAPDEGLASYAALNNCTSGAFCLFAQTSYGGARLAVTACPTTLTSFPGLTGVRSIQNNRASGTVRAYTSATLRATLSPGAGAPSLTAGVTSVTCG